MILVQNNLHSQFDIKYKVQVITKTSERNSRFVVIVYRVSYFNNKINWKDVGKGIKNG